MYNQIKKAIYKVIPKNFIIKNELLFRKVIYPFYKGDNHECNICQKKNKSFVLNQRGEKLCPSCGSMPRDRRLFLLFQKYLKNSDSVSLLDFSPSRSLYRYFSKQKAIKYFPTDLSTDFIAKYNYDITNIPLEDHFFDRIFCYHILEHIDQDTKAMQELYRVLKKDGVIFIQTPFKDGNIYENPEIKTEEDRLKHFGQEDHVRIYSVEGLADRLRSVGFIVEINHLEKDDFLGLEDHEKVLILSKN